MCRLDDSRSSTWRKRKEGATSSTFSSLLRRLVVNSSPRGRGSTSGAHVRGVDKGGFGVARDETNRG